MRPRIGDGASASLAETEVATSEPDGDPTTASLSDASSPALFGLQVLVVEDEILVAMTLEDLLADFGCVVAGVACSLKEGLSQAGSTSIDAAILDVNLSGQMVFPIADLLSARGVPFLFSTAYGDANLVQRYPGSLVLQKPYQPQDLADALTALVRRPIH